ncbi:hypothetical protein BD769DRAFT_861347 [Suillus cothurnatus]|nr:hypothetical protein BD769DRAFT_861347 [Suillus cothurnatus]
MRTWAIELILSFVSHAKLIACNRKACFKTSLRFLPVPITGLFAVLNIARVADYTLLFSPTIIRHSNPSTRSPGLQYSKSLLHTILRACPAPRIRFVYEGEAELRTPQLLRKSSTLTLASSCDMCVDPEGLSGNLFQDCRISP